MAANYQLPGSLEPPDYGEMARIGALQGEVEHRALSQLRREIGLRNMQRETVASVQAGVDPILARRNALFNNARFLFADNPAALVQLQNSEEARATRDAYQRALLQLRGEQVAGQIENWQALAKSRAETAEAQAAHAAAIAKPAALRTAEEVGALGASIPVMQQTASILGPQLTEPQRAELQRQIAVKQGAHEYLVGPRKVAEEGLKLAQEREQRLIDQALEAGKRAGKSFALRRAATIANLVANGKKPEEAEVIVDKLLAPESEGAPSTTKRLKWTGSGFVPVK